MATKTIRTCKNPSKIAAISGHRSLPWRDNERHPLCMKTRRCISDAIVDAHKSGINTFLVGLALGADVLFAQEVLRLRAEGYRIYLVGAIPSEQQSVRWRQEDQERYFHIREQCDALYVHDPAGSMGFGAACLGRDDWMVDNASLLIAYYDGRNRGGTMHTVSYARKQGKPVINLFSRVQTENERPPISGRSPTSGCVNRKIHLSRTQIPENLEMIP